MVEPSPEYCSQSMDCWIDSDEGGNYFMNLTTVANT